jgi:hypothetical protein
MKHCDFEIVRVEEDRIFIIDLDLGNKSVTNDTEWVYNVLTKNFPNKRIIYRNSVRDWNEIAYSANHNFKYGFFHPIIVIPYNQHLPDESEVTGCPSSVFFEQPNKIEKILNKYPNSQSLKSYYKNYYEK